MNFIELRAGKSVERSDIRVYRSEIKAAKYTYLMAGVHGDEVEGVYLLQELFSWLKENDEINIPLIVIPILNQDGYRSGNRINSHAVDLNRNLPSKGWSEEVREAKYHPGPAPLSEPENQFLVKLLTKFPPHLIISFHSWKPMLNYNGGNCRKFADYLAKYNNYPVVAEIEGHPTPGSLGEYGPQELQAQVLTFETPQLTDGQALKDIWEENKVGLKGLLSSDLILSS